jgi:mRNA interferase RelE/StbE
MYQVRFTSKGLEQIEQLSKAVAQQVLKKLRWMAENFDQATHTPLTGNLKGVFKLRVGDYRAL